MLKTPVFPTRNTDRPRVHLCTKARRSSCSRSNRRYFALQVGNFVHHWRLNLYIWRAGEWRRGAKRASGNGILTTTHGHKLDNATGQIVKHTHDLTDRIHQTHSQIIKNKYVHIMAYTCSSTLRPSGGLGFGREGDRFARRRHASAHQTAHFGLDIGHFGTERRGVVVVAIVVVVGAPRDRRPRSLRGRN